MSTARTSRRTRRWPGGSSPSWCPSRPPDDAIAILRGLRDRYEAHHQVRYTDEALVAAVELSDRYITDRFLPDKAIDLIDQAGARVRLRTKTPGRDVRDLERRAEELLRDKDQAVASEQYELASQLRDQIDEVRRQIDAAGRGRELRCPRSPSTTSPRWCPGPPASR